VASKFSIYYEINNAPRFSRLEVVLVIALLRIERHCKPRGSPDNYNEMNGAEWESQCYSMNAHQANIEW
jgi:hypothetical protein